MLRPRQPVFSMAAMRAGALRWIWLCVSIRSKGTSAERPVLTVAAAGTIANNSRLVISVVPSSNSIAEAGVTPVIQICAKRYGEGMPTPLDDDKEDVEPLADA